MIFSFPAISGFFWIKRFIFYLQYQVYLKLKTFIIYLQYGSSYSALGQLVTQSLNNTFDFEDKEVNQAFLDTSRP